MQFACLIYNDPKDVFDHSPEAEAMLAEVGPHNEKLRQSGHFVSGIPLVLPRDARTVRVRAGKASVTDGPYLETKEMLGGVMVIEARDMEEAVEIAKGIPFARRGSIEVRPLVDFSKPRPTA